MAKVTYIITKRSRASEYRAITRTRINSRFRTHSSHGIPSMFSARLARHLLLLAEGPNVWRLEMSADNGASNHAKAAPESITESSNVGYCHPPKETRFKRGQSGNPSGRPKGSLSFAAE